MKLSVTVAAAALAAVLASTSLVTAHPRKARLVVTPSAAVNPEVAKLVRSGVHPEVARMIVSSRPGIIPNYIHYERVQAMDTLTGVPPSLSGSSLANPWTNYSQFEPGTGRRR